MRLYQNTRISTSDDTDLEHLYKRMVDHNGHFLDKIIQICKMLDIDSKDIIPK